jgi:hypothetical protein
MHRIFVRIHQVATKGALHLTILTIFRLHSDCAPNSPFIMAVVPSEEEMLSQQLIARLLDEEGSLAAAAALQELFALQDSTPKRKGRSGPHLGEPFEDQDSYVAIRMMANEAWAAADSTVAQNVHNREGVQTSSDRQYAMRLAAAEQRDQLDMEFAKALQRLEDEGGRDISGPSMLDVEDVLGSDMVQSIMVSNSFIRCCVHL